MFLQFTLWAYDTWETVKSPVSTAWKWDSKTLGAKLSEAKSSSKVPPSGWLCSESNGSLNSPARCPVSKSFPGSSVTNVLGERELLWTLEPLDHFRFPFRFWEFPDSLVLRMSLHRDCRAGNYSVLTISLDPLTLEWILNFISHILILWEHCYSTASVSWGHNSHCHSWTHFLLDS